MYKSKSEHFLLLVNLLTSLLFFYVYLLHCGLLSGFNRARSSAHLVSKLLLAKETRVRFGSKSGCVCVRELLKLGLLNFFNASDKKLDGSASSYVLMFHRSF